MKKRIIPLMLSILLVIGLLIVDMPPVYALSGFNGFISCGTNHTAALKSDGTLWIWGWNFYGELGDGTATQRSKPVKVMSGVKFVSCGGDNTAAVKSDGTLWVWGRNLKEALRDGSTADRMAPVQVMTDVTAVSTGDGGIYALKSNGDLYCIRNSSFLTVGYNSENPYEPAKIMSGVAMISSGSLYTMVVKTDGTLWGWGRNDSGQLGIGNITLEPKIKPVQVMEGVASVFAGSEHAIALKTDGTVWTWGYNTSGELGYETAEYYSATPTQVMTDVSAVSAGYSHFMALKNDGTLWTWGNNGNGQLGDGTTTRRMKPVKVMTDVVDIYSGRATSMAVKSDGTLWVWGYNLSGQAGDGTKTDQHSPVKIMSGIMMIGKAAPAETKVAAPETKTVTATPTKSKVYVDGLEKSFEAYAINGNNYFKLRDIAMVLNGTKKQFEVGYSKEKNAIYMTSQTPYTPVGGEMTLSGATDNRQGIPTASKLYIDGKEISFTAYSIGGNNYFKLRDIGKAFDFGVGWDNVTKAISILTSSGYTE